jgi:threonine dehydrogenase-like Zn-dependent dehydrogenase
VGVVEALPNMRVAAESLGADLVVDPTVEPDLAGMITAYVGTARGPSLVIEASGSNDALATVFDVAGYHARVRLIGHSIGRKVPVEIGKTIWRAFSISGRSGVSEFTPRTIGFIDRIRQAVDIRAIISHRVPFDDVQEAFDLAAGRRDDAIKVMVTF